VPLTSAAELWRVVSDDGVWPWYGGQKPSLQDAREQAAFMGESWRWHGVHKWIAYDRVSGEVVGRGGLSRTPVDEDWGQLYAFLPAEPWVRVAHERRESRTTRHSRCPCWSGTPILIGGKCVAAGRRAVLA
jgi:hypothetical protein